MDKYAVIWNNADETAEIIAIKDTVDEAKKVIKKKMHEFIELNEDVSGKFDVDEFIASYEDPDKFIIEEKKGKIPYLLDYNYGELVVTIQKIKV